jgi:hypothetical protein
MKRMEFTKAELDLLLEIIRDSSYEAFNKHLTDDENARFANHLLTNLEMADFKIINVEAS